MGPPGEKYLLFRKADRTHGGGATPWGPHREHQG